MSVIKPKHISKLIAVTLFAMVFAIACASSDPEELVIPVNITDGEMTPSTINVKQGDMVTLKIDADEGGEFHLHTYDIESEIDPESVTDFYFVAEATGRFKITYHPLGAHGGSAHGGGAHGGGAHGGGAHGKHDHGDLFESEELAPGATFSYEVDEHQAGKTVPYHSHLRPALNGKIMVSDGHGHKQVDAITIEYSDEAASPNEVHVSPGTLITWINNSSIPQTVVSGLHADFVEDEHKDAGMSMDTGGHSDKDAHDDEEKEIEIGIVEVQPR